MINRTKQRQEQLSKSKPPGLASKPINEHVNSVHSTPKPVESVKQMDVKVPTKIGKENCQSLGQFSTNLPDF